MSKYWIVIGCVLGGLAVFTGAFGAHGLESHLNNKHELGDSNESTGADRQSESQSEITVDEVDNDSSPSEIVNRRLEQWNTAAQYQMYHAAALILLGLVAGNHPRRATMLSGWAFVVGIACFSGGLYVLVVTGITAIGASFVPLGGLFFLGAWGGFAWDAWTRCSSDSSSTSNTNSSTN